MGSPQAVVAQRPEGRALWRARTGRADDGGDIFLHIPSIRKIKDRYILSEDQLSP